MNWGAKVEKLKNEWNFKVKKIRNKRRTIKADISKTKKEPITIESYLG